jgi:hypothetical protein
MFFGGWLYPDGTSDGCEAREVAFEDAVDCAARGADIAYAISAASKRPFKAL